MMQARNFDLVSSNVSNLERSSEIREEQRNEEQNLAMRMVSVEMFRDTVEAFGRYVKHTLSILFLETQHYEMLLQRVSPDGKEQVSRAFGEMRKEIKLIETGIGSMLSFSRLVSEKYSKRHR